MFVRNPDSIKRLTVKVNDDICNYLSENGFTPISKCGESWIFIKNNKISSLISQYEKGGDIVESK